MYLTKIPASLASLILIGCVVVFAAPPNGACLEKKELNIIGYAYHRFGDNRYPSTNVAVEDFESHLEYLQQEGYKVVNLSEAIGMLEGERAVQEKVAVITIDDGYQSFYENGMPLLRRYGYPATIFVHTAAVGNHDYMSWEQLREIRAQGMEIGNHSHSHEHFVNAATNGRLEVFVDDLRRSQLAFRSELGEEPKLYSYPYGEYTNAMAANLKNFGIIGAVAQNSGVISRHSDVFALPRFPVGGSYADVAGFKRKSTMRALPVDMKNPPKHIVGADNPPLLQVRLTSDRDIQPGAMQCFVAGSDDCRIDYHAQSRTVTVRASSPLEARRTLYTVTAPSSTIGGGWFWFSHVWIRPGVAE